MKQGLLGITSRTIRRRPGAHAAKGLGAVLAIGVLASSGCQDPYAGGAPTRWNKDNHGHGKGVTLPSIPERPTGVSVAALLEKAKQHFSPLPETAESRRNPATEEKIALGRMLYHDKRLSAARDLSCASCHDLEAYGIDVREQEGLRSRTSLGHEAQAGDRNAPTVYNAGLYLAQFWDGRAKDLEEQAKGPVLNPVEMAMADEASVIRTLRAVPGYERAFAAAFPGEGEPITYDNVAKAIGAFERQLMTPGPFDAFLDGKLTALDEQQLRGLDLFIGTGCVQCHVGPAVGGTMYQKLGTVKPWPDLKDTGRAKITKAATDEYVFKVPSLRNITETGPYLHDGSILSLDVMVQKMAEHQLGKGEFEPDQLKAVLAFLGSLKGELPEAYLAVPTLPPDGPGAPPPVDEEEVEDEPIEHVVEDEADGDGDGEADPA